MAVSLLLALGCASHPPRVDVPSETTRLLERDRAWAAAASAGKHVEGVVAFWADDAGVFLLDSRSAPIRREVAMRE